MAERSASIEAKPASSSRGGGLLLQRKCACGTHTSGGDCTECAKRKQAGLQREANPGSLTQAPSSYAVAPQLVQGGMQLPADIRASLAPRYGSDFSEVRVHHDAASQVAAGEVGARAFTLGQHIHFGAGQWRPQERDGIRLIAHELGHTLQQRGASDVPAGRVGVGAADSPLEREADAAADAALAGRTASVRRGGAAGVQTMLLQRDPKPGATGIGTVALASLLREDLFAAKSTELSVNPLAPKPPHFAPKAKRLIYLHMAGAPSQLDLFDYKPKLVELNGQDCPDSLFKKDRFAFIKGVPKLLGTPRKFAQHGQGGVWLSDAVPHLHGVADEMCVIRSMFTEQFNHAPAELLLYTGSARSGRPSMGSWVTYGLGTENEDLPGFVVLISSGVQPNGGKNSFGSGFLPSVFQGVQCRSKGDPVLYASDPAGMDRDLRRESLDALRDRLAA